MVQFTSSLSAADALMVEVVTAIIVEHERKFFVSVCIY